MHIKGVNEIEMGGKVDDYDRVKLDIVFDNDTECLKVWNEIKDHNKSVEDNYWEKFNPVKDLVMIAFLHYNHKTKSVSVEDNLLSAYFDGEWDFPNELLKRHAFERCKEYVSELYSTHTLEELYNKYGLYYTYDLAERTAANENPKIL